MSEQFPLNFEVPKQNPYEAMSLDELKVQYKDKVGVSPRIGRDDREQLIHAIQNPETERDELRALDVDDDKTDIRNTYRH